MVCHACLPASLIGNHIRYSEMCQSFFCSCLCFDRIQAPSIIDSRQMYACEWTRDVASSLNAYDHRFLCRSLDVGLVGKRIGIEFHGPMHYATNVEADMDIADQLELGRSAMRMRY